MSDVEKIISDIIQITSDLFWAFAIYCFPKGCKRMAESVKALTDKELRNFVGRSGSAHVQSRAFFRTYA